MSFLDIQAGQIVRAKKTATILPGLTLTCQHALSSMWSIRDKLNITINTVWGRKKLPPYKQFVSIYFYKNMTYLRAAYVLAIEGSCSPSLDLQRTAFETILRGYLFIVEKAEADLLYSYIEGTIGAKERKALRDRKFYPFDHLLNELYTSAPKKAHKQLFHLLSRHSHPSILGAVADIKYSEVGVENCLKTILCLVFGTVQMLAEGFFDLLDSGLKSVVAQTLKEIADFLGEVPLFEPDQNRWSASIKLKRGNFLTILGNP